MNYLITIDLLAIMNNYSKNEYGWGFLYWNEFMAIYNKWLDWMDSKIWTLIVQTTC